MMKKVIANALFKASDSYKAVNLTTTRNNDIDVYLKNSFVSLYTAKHYNPDADVILITNYDIKEDEKRVFKDNDIKIIKISCKLFKFPENFKWAPAFFKLEALKYLCSIYDLICVLDTDTIFTRECKNMWEESKQSILIFDIDYALDSPKRKITTDLSKKLFGNDRNINHWGGEIIVGNSISIIEFIAKCELVYEKIKNNLENINSSFGQEALISIAIENHGLKIERANKYCMRYWTRRFYLIDTNYNNIPIWHLPAEKDWGLIKIYYYIVRKKNIPSKNYISKKVFLKRKMNIFQAGVYFLKILFIKLQSRDKMNFKRRNGWIDR